MIPEQTDSLADNESAILQRIYVTLWSPGQPTRTMLAGENDSPKAEPLILPIGVFDELFRNAGVRNGDEVTISIKRTGRRPWEEKAASTK